ncbi:MAG: imidazolonepropionase [Alphaproteobacteria bacterium]|nr:imidazolonepropionase [Alphaproteobacteria bacterium]
MRDTLITGIDTLLTMDPSVGEGPLGVLHDVSVHVDGSEITWIGPASDAPSARETIDGTGCIALPGLVDCHTHAVWAGSRADEFEKRLAGASYTSILEGGGGILSTVRASRAASEEQLAAGCASRLARMRARGVGTVEVKSGYGLEPAAELKLIQAARRAGKLTGVRVFPTFLGAHAIPPDWRSDREGYVEQVIEDQLPIVAQYASFIDVYVDDGAFTVEEGERILRAGMACGLKPRVHAEQIAYTGAAAMAARLGALSADHLERLDDAGVAAMAASGTIAGLLPGAMLYLRDTPPPVAKLREAGVPLAIATDLNPGSSPVDDLWACATLACLTMGLTVEEALRGITCVAADALGQPDLGRLRVGSPGPVVLVRPPPSEAPHPAVLVQHFGCPRIEAVVG